MTAIAEGGTFETPTANPATAVLLFVALSLLLLAFFVGLVLVSIGRRRRGQRRSSRAPQTDVNAWEEAGRRAEPPDRPQRPSRD